MDLVLEDVMLLDIGDSIFIWLGRMSNENERKACIVSAQVGSESKQYQKHYHYARWESVSEKKTHKTIHDLVFQEYLDCDPSGRDKDVPIIVVKQGFEPPNFTGFFGAWDPNLRGVKIILDLLS